MVGLNSPPFIVLGFAETLEELGSISHSTQLTTLKSFEEKEIMDMVHLSPNMDPYPDQTPRNVLSREYSYDVPVLTTGQTHVLFAQRLWQQQLSVSRYLSLFKYFKASFKIKVFLTNSPSLYGLVGVSVLPYMSDFTKYTIVEQQCQASMVLLDITQQNCAEFDLPFYTPYDFYDTAQIDEPCWRISIHCFQVSNVGDEPSVVLKPTVFYSAYDIHTAGYLEPIAFQSDLRLAQYSRNAAVGALGSSAVWLANMR